MHRNDTIAAISTPQGVGGIAVIRISGPQAVSIIRKLLSAEKLLNSLENHKAFHGWIQDKGEPVDEVVVTLFCAPHSYTGEDVIEISCHGGAWVSRRILELLQSQGARLAEPGEFTQRRFLNGKIDLVQAEAVADLIHAQTEAARRVAVYQLEGRLSLKLLEMRGRLIHAVSLLEVELDFAEEDIEFTSREELFNMLRNLQKTMRLLLDTFDRGRVCRDGIRMAIVGRPNVGKSSILNCLIEKERAIVTDIPGTTRDTIEEVLDIEGILFRITDTAGIRETQDPIEREGVNRAEKALLGSDLVLLVLDRSESLQKEDHALIERIEKMKVPFLLTINKSDLPQKITDRDLKEIKAKYEFLPVSALKSKGILNLIEWLKKSALSRGMPHEGEVVLTNQRHRTALERTLNCIHQAEISFRESMSQEFITMDLRGALDFLGEITGHTSTDEILNHIFNEFCIGK